MAGGLAAFTGRDAEAKRKRKRTGAHVDANKKKHGAVLADKRRKKKKKCKRGTIKCAKVCVTASTDAQNCGGCGNRCGTGAACLGGVCQVANPTCPSGQIRCDGQCVDPASNEAHCGGCGQQCQGDLTCLDGACGCADAGETQCGASCVDLESDKDHCGGCGSACGAGQRCQDGQCVTATCGANELLCNGTCVPSVGDHPCCSQIDCGATGPNNHIFCDTTQHQCRCTNSNYGVCSRTPDGRGICDECCEGGIGTLNCQGEMGCNGLNFCTCPTGTSKCPGGDYRCFQNPANPDGTLDDPTTCSSRGATSCVDCTLGGTRPYVCCWGGDCAIASGYNPGEGGAMGGFCGGCTRCEPGEMCCKNNTGGPSCKIPIGSGVCPPIS